MGRAWPLPPAVSQLPWLLGAPGSLHLNSFCACFSRKRGAASRFSLQFLLQLSQNQGFSKHFHFSMLGGGNPIYSLIFCMLREAVNDQAEGDATSAAGGQACCHL